MKKSVWSTTLALVCALLLGTLLSPAQATETVLHSFTPNYSNGAYPVGQLALSGSTLYGMTEYGINGGGDIFSMTTAGLVKTLHEFAGGANDGYQPNAGLVLVGSTFYGTTIYGGTGNVGVVFKVDTSGNVTLLHSFTGYNSTNPSLSDGSYPYAALMLGADGMLYGTTDTGGTSNQGTVFKISTDGKTYSLVHSFNSTTDTVYNPLTALAQAPSGVLYGTAYNASGFNGGLYKLNTDGSGFTFVHGFSGSDPLGYSPHSDLITATDGNLYGTCANGGVNTFGTVYKIVPGSTDTLSTLWSFDGETGAYPGPSNASYAQNKLFQAADHNLYGVTQEGGAYGWGTAFKLTLAGVCTTFTSFNSTDAYGAANPPVQSGTSFYLTSYYGGVSAVINSTNGYGAGISLSSSGSLKVIQSFYLRDGYTSYGNLVLIGTGSSAAYYGVTYYGGEFNNGTIFKISATGAFSIIHHLNNYYQEGAQPSGGLMLYSDGKTLYGTTTSGGKYGYGTIFKVTTAGALTVIHHFQYKEGYSPQAALVEGTGKDTNLYGTAYQGGPNQGSAAGTIFKVTTAGTLTVLHYCVSGSKEGANPACTLLPDGSGNFYGTTYTGGANNLGMIFKISNTGSSFTDLFDFYYDSVHGIYPVGYYPYLAGKMVLVGGILYGTVQSGGAHGNGVVWQLNTSTNAASAFYSFNNSNGDGNAPYGGIIYNSSTGYFYGTCYNGGANGLGTIYKLNQSTGAFVLLYTFTGYNSGNPPASDGASPYGGVIVGADGNLYGTTAAGGSTNNGSVFQSSP